MPEDPQPAGGQRVDSFGTLPRRKRRELIMLAALRSTATTTVLLVAYATLPFTRLGETRYLIAMLIGLVIVVAALAVQFWQTTRSPYPRLRAVEAMMTSAPLFTVVFATTHYLINELNPGSYTQPMTRLDALYYTVTTFATVGYGDISPVSQPARVAALVQMVCGLLLVGLIAKLLFGVAQNAEQRITADPADPTRSRPHPPSAGRQR